MKKIIVCTMLLFSILVFALSKKECCQKVEEELKKCVTDILDNVDKLGINISHREIEKCEAIARQQKIAECGGGCAITK